MAERSAPMIAAAGVCAAAWPMVGLALWNLRRGFDITDEGFLLLLYERPADGEVEGVTQFHRLVAAVVPGALEHIVTYRVLKLGLLVLTAAVFATALMRYVRVVLPSLAAHLLPAWAMVHLSVVGALLAYCLAAQTLSYNDLVTAMMMLLGAVILRHAALRRPIAAKAGIAHGAAAGALLVFLIFVKVSAGLALISLTLVAPLLLAERLGRRERLHGLAGLAAGAGATILLAANGASWSLFSPSALWRSLFVDLAVQPSQDIGATLFRYADFTVERVPRFLTETPLAAVVAATLAISIVTTLGPPALRSTRLRPALLLAAAVAVGGIVLVLPAWARNEQFFFFRYYLAEPYLGLVALAAAAVLVARHLAPASPDHPRFWWLCLFLLALPFAGAFGTGNELLTQLIVHAAPLLLLLALLLGALQRATRSSLAVPALLGLAVCTAVLQLGSLTLLHPYRLPSSGLAQDHEIHEPAGLRGLWVDELTAGFLEEVRRAGAGTSVLDEGEPVLGFYDVPGLVYVLGGTSPGLPWYFSTDEWQPAICYGLQRAAARVAEAELVLLTRPLLPETRRCLADLGVEPEGLQIVAEIVNPYPFHDTLTVSRRAGS